MTTEIWSTKDFEIGAKSTNKQTNKQKFLKQSNANLKGSNIEELKFFSWKVKLHIQIEWQNTN